MLDITRDTANDPNGRVIELDWHPPHGPCVRLTPAEWRQLVRWIFTHDGAV